MNSFQKIPVFSFTIEKLDALDVHILIKNKLNLLELTTTYEETHNRNNYITVHY